jgi:uncharacterized membrane protein
LHPVAVIALIVLVANDHAWKYSHPGWLTGKLSDVAGLIVFPLVLCAALHVVSASERLLAGCVAATMIGFALVKLWAPATQVCEWAMGWLQAPFSSVTPTTLVRDPTDLLALPFAIVALWLPRRASLAHHA